jgi:hypothetical protein
MPVIATSIVLPHTARFIEQITQTIQSRDSSGNASAMNWYPAFPTRRSQFQVRERHALIRFCLVHVILVS